MRLKDLMEAPLIKDDDTVTLILEVPGVGTVKKKGKLVPGFYSGAHGQRNKRVHIQRKREEVDRIPEGRKG